MISRSEALALVEQYVKNPNSRKHMLATEAIMRRLAQHFNESEAVWGLTGLLHDLDMELVDFKNEPAKHARESVAILQSYDVPEEVLRGILAHNEFTGQPRETLLEKCIYSTDPMTGLIVAATLVLPEKKLSSLQSESITRRFKEKSFAAGANREIIAACEDFGMSLEEFSRISLAAMQGIASDLGL
jgi:hypothetical protein